MDDMLLSAIEHGVFFQQSAAVARRPPTRLSPHPLACEARDVLTPVPEQDCDRALPWRSSHACLPSLPGCAWRTPGDEGPFCEVAQVVDCHGVTVGHQEREEEEVEQEVEGEKEEEHSNNSAHVHGCDESEKTSASGLSHVVMNELDDATTDRLQCAQCCMVRLSACVASFMLLSTMVSPML